MFKTVCALIVGMLVFVGCREAKRSPEEQAKIDEYIAELYARVEAEKKEEAQTKQIGSILANTAAATNPRDKAVAYWPMALIDAKERKWPTSKLSHESSPPVIAYSVNLNADPFDWSIIIASRDFSGSIDTLRTVAQSARFETCIGPLRDKATYGSSFGEGTGGNEVLEWKLTETTYESNNVVQIYFRVKR